MGTSTVASLTAVISANNTKFKKGVGGAKSSLGGFKKSIGALGPMIAGAFAVGAIKNFAKASMEAYDVQDKAEKSLLTALDGRENAQKKLIAQAKELQELTLFGDEETIKAQALIAAFVSEEEQIKKVIPLVQDLAAAKGMQLSVAADLVSKTLGSSTNALSRYGIEVKGAVGSTERLESLMWGLEEAFDGQAVAAAEAGMGSFTQLSNSVGDLREQMGETITLIVGKMLPALEKAVDFLHQAFLTQRMIKRQSLDANILYQLEQDKAEAIALGNKYKEYGLELDGDQTYLQKAAVSLLEQYQKVLQNTSADELMKIELLTAQITELEYMAGITPKSGSILAGDLPPILKVKEFEDDAVRMAGIFADINDWEFGVDAESLEMESILKDINDWEFDTTGPEDYATAFDFSMKKVKTAGEIMSDSLAVAFSQIGSAFAQSLGEMAAGTKTFEEALKDIGAMIASALGDILILVGMSTTPIGIPLVLAGLALKGFGSFVGAGGFGGESIGNVQPAFTNNGEEDSRIYGNDIMVANDYAVNTYNRVG